MTGEQRSPYPPLGSEDSALLGTAANLNSVPPMWQDDDPAIRSGWVLRSEVVDEMRRLYCFAFCCGVLTGVIGMMLVVWVIS